MSTLIKEFTDVIDQDHLTVDSYVPYQHKLRAYGMGSTTNENEHLIQERLKWNGITCTPNDSRKPRRRYRFYIAQLECFYILESVRRYEQQHHQPLLLTSKTKTSTPWKWKKISAKSMQKDVHQARQLAIRSLYILGYDLGVVEVSVFPQFPKKIVSGFLSFPFSSRDSKWKGSLHQILRQVRNDDIEWNKQVKLGTDIEFVLRRKNGRYVPASRFFNKTGKVGYDAIWLRGHRHHYPLAELRPEPDENPKQLFQKLKACMLHAAEKIKDPNIEWLAGGKPMKGYPIGGHIHFSGVPLTSRLVRSLDNYLTLPLFLLESDLSLSRRPKYGPLGDVRKQFHGGFEYRTPPSWIIDPELAQGILCLSKVIATDYRALSWMPLNQHDIQRAFYAGERDEIKPLIEYLWNDIQQCSSYAIYAQWLDSFYSRVMFDPPWQEYLDIKWAWGLTPMSSKPVV